MADKLDGKSLDINQENLAKLKSLFPNLVKEGQLDIGQLKDTFGQENYVGQEYYGLNWAGKQEAFKEIQKQTTDTLLPDVSNSINFDTTENIFIEGENLEALKVLQRAYFGKVKMIYIDPPYNTGNDSFIYPDDYTETKEEYLQRTGEKDESGYINKQALFKKNTKENGQYHSVWLSMMYPRLYLARNLLSEDGAIFVSINDNEQANLKLLLDDVFGEENFVANLIWESKYTVSNDANYVSDQHESVLFYAKHKETFSIGRLARTDEQNQDYKDRDNDPKGPWKPTPLHAKSGTEKSKYEITFDNGIKWTCPAGRYPRYSKNTLIELYKNGELYFNSNGGVDKKTYLQEVQAKGVVPGSILKYEEVGHTHANNEELAELLGKGIFDNPKGTKLLLRLITIANVGNNDLILDFFAGSGTTAQAVLELNQEDGGNRKFILIQMPEKCDTDSEAFKAGYEYISDITRERIKRVIEKIKKEKDGKLKLEKDIDLGFKSFKLGSSNFQIWRGDVHGEALKDQLKLHRNPVVRDDEEAMLYELILKAGLPLSAKIEKITVDKINIYNVQDGQLLLALSKLNQKVIDKIRELKPKTCICLDRLFEKNDKFKTNTKLQLRDDGIEFRSL